jgi:hypothetical protein
MPGVPVGASSSRVAHGRNGLKSVAAAQPAARASMRDESALAFASTRVESTLTFAGDRRARLRQRRRPPRRQQPAAPPGAAATIVRDGAIAVVTSAADDFAFRLTVRNPSF